MWKTAENSVHTTNYALEYCSVVELLANVIEKFHQTLALTISVNTIKVIESDFQPFNKGFFSFS